MDKTSDYGFRIAKACRVLGKLELTRALRGHISARIPGTNRIFIRARGPAESGVRYTTQQEVVEIGLDGKPTDTMPDGLRAPSEVFIHTEIYRAPRGQRRAASASADGGAVHHLRRAALADLWRL
jgi:ribulose-5-phosphate 4-epimerase/fuculose-1-phosphate aldolase